VFHDLQHKRHPEFFRWFDLPFWELLLWASASRSRGLIAISDATARDLERYYPGVSGKTTVVPHGVDPEFFRVAEHRAAKKYLPVNQKYLLTVSTLHPHKNIGRLLEAFHLFRSAHPEYRLVIAGIKGYAAEELETRRRDLDLEASVTFTGWIPRAALYELYENADAYIAPSRFEGFGMTIVEALAAGIPSACSAIAPLSQIVGSAAIQFDPDSVSGIAAAMEVVTADASFRERAPAAGVERAKNFNWEKTAALTLNEMEKVVMPHPTNGGPHSA
jgi:glycosyltransferase involved in cell wall biosynthesis